ncbi:hypothetical protein NDU88_007960 [Pleurodeles waltl]|uniref:Reverse transcriptase n=1 Tax=Pleurodeles waltl TaxID=8319 RepID=A0AAV7N3K8_PLEWA|nr:hypothetical protein NDU88_007960 [Pleurodeles waltl]
MERPGVTLATLLHPGRKNNVILQIQDDSGRPAVTDYLNDIAMSWLTAEHRDRLMAPLRPEEIKAVLKDMPAGKSPGTDGLTVACYKAY